MANAARRRKEVFPVKIMSNTEIATGVFLLAMEKQFDFKAGQVLAATINPDDDLRLYSIASGTDENTLQILFDVNPQGQLTPPLSKMRTGETLYISQPFGRFTDSPDDAWWIATGTGIAPFVSMIKSGEAKKQKLLQGARYLTQFYFADLFKEKMGNRYLRFCTGESAPDVIHGRLTNFIRESNDIMPDRKYYLCGNANMVVEVRDILLEKGVPFDHIIAEIYF
ncbi:FAD-binding oxidoreductase [Geofilum sp. OHC36d9]|uniref:FAD-binding oxidoreductase n=1 Tax=Geofilum sp. OHC36d9 TaxID=3458413 RepID=UPI004034BEB5